MTRSQAWEKLLSDGAVAQRLAIKGEIHRGKKKLAKAFAKVNSSSWKEESDMYEPIIHALRDGMYDEEKGVFVVDTHSKGAFHADISIADQKDDRLPYSLRYFIELKMQRGNLISPDNCGQILDYFNAIHEKQPYRTNFVAILSNFEQSWVFIAECDEQNVRSINQRPADNFTEAVIFAHNLSYKHYSKVIPDLDARFGSQYSVLAISPNHFLLSVPQPKPIPAHNKLTIGSSEDDCWHTPSRHGCEGPFAMKIVRGEHSVANEVAILKKFRDNDCQHLPEIVWSPAGNLQLGISPVGESVDFREPQTTSRAIVHGLIEGLKHLHGLGIVHRDIRPSNLFLDYGKSQVNLVIIDYETAVILDDVSQGVSYCGGFMSWPKRLLEENTLIYIPNPEDDLLACILVVLHMLFPLRFDSFPARYIGVASQGRPSKETLNLLDLWADIEKSCVWKPFVRAARLRDYELLKGMADVFCYV